MDTRAEMIHLHQNFITLPHPQVLLSVEKQLTEHMEQSITSSHIDTTRQKLLSTHLPFKVPLTTPAHRGSKAASVKAQTF